MTDETPQQLHESGSGELAGGGIPASELGYAQAAAELDRLIAELDQGLVDVDLLENRFRRAIEIVEELDRRIHAARERVDELLPRLDAIAAKDPE